MIIDDEVTVSAATLGLALGLSRKRVEQLAAEGVVRRKAKGEFPLLPGIRGYLEWLKDAQRKAARSASAGALQEARAEEIRLRTADKRREHEAKGQAAAIDCIDMVAGPLRADLLAALPRLVEDLALRRQLEDAIDDAFGAMSKRATAIADELQRRGHLQPITRKARASK